MPTTPRFCLALTLTLAFASSPFASEIVDLRDGVGTTFYGAQYTGFPPTGDFFGWGIAFGDFDGDGHPDFLGSSANADGPNDAYGPEYDAYLFFGRQRSQVDSLYAVDTPGVANIVFYKGGYGMACADLDNDGFDDVILSEPNGSSAGIFIVFGRPRADLLHAYDFNIESPNYTPPDVFVPGRSLGGTLIDITNSAVDLASRSLATGDLNGDGYADIAFGNIHARGPFGGRANGGATYVVFGRPRSQFPPVIDVDYASAEPHPDVAIFGEDGDEFPFTLAIGDFDGDATDDLLCGGRGRGEENIARGEIYGIWGRQSWQSTYDLQIEQFDFALDGSSVYQIETGDIDRDGREEFIVGSPNGDWVELPDGRFGMGGYRIYFGRPKNMWPRWSNAVGMTDVFIVGADGGDAISLSGQSQWAITLSMAAGNLDNDGYQDLLLGAGYGYRPSPDPAQSAIRAGRAYLIRGRPRGAWQPFIDLRDTYDVQFYGVDGCNNDGYCTSPPGFGADLFGYTTSMADFDGNGVDELFISAPHADGPNNMCIDCGEIYLIFNADSLATPIAPTPPSGRLVLLPNYPNPFATSTTFSFDAPEGALVSLTVYDAHGREVASPLVPLQARSGRMDIHWDGRDRNGRSLASGVYFVKLRAGSASLTRKVVLVR